MENNEKFIKACIKSSLGLENIDKTDQCPNEYQLMQYCANQLDKEQSGKIEQHISSCGFCVSQLSIASQSKLISNADNLQAVPNSIINKTKSALGINKITKNKQTKKIRSRLLLALAVVFFLLSFLIPRYFIQCLVVTLIVGLRWSFDSEGARTFVMVLDSWRQHSHDKDDEIANRLKNRH